MTSEILIETGLTETRIAQLRDGRLDGLTIERAADAGQDGAGLVGAIYLGRVQRVVAAMNAAFVEIGRGRAGFLTARDAWRLAPPLAAGAAPSETPQIGRHVREGQAIVVQAVKEPIGGKGTRLTTDVTMPGRLLVLVPFGTGAALSRRIEDSAERARLGEILGPLAERLGTGLVARTLAFGAGAAELSAEAEQLLALWRSVADRARSATPPARLFADLGPVQRALRDQADSGTSRIVVDDARAHAEASAYARDHAPGLAERIVLSAGPALFERHGIEAAIARALDRRVALPSGGWITIDETEALTAIDVNSGKFADAASPEEASRRVNLEATDEICRQLRLRDIGGLVVADFIQMESAPDIDLVLDALRAGFAQDRAPTDISWVAEFGLAVLTRKRVRPSLGHRLTASCPCCRGSGRVRTPATVAGSVLRRLEVEARAAPGRPLRAAVSPAVLGWLNAQPDLRDRLTRRIGAQVEWEARDGGAAGAFEIWRDGRQEKADENQ